MIVSESHVDDAVHAALEALKKTGVTFDSDEMSILNDRITHFLTEDCQVSVEQTVSFGDLKDDQWMSWMELARQAQTDRGEDVETISSEDTEKQAEYLFALHEGSLPVPTPLDEKQHDLEKLAKARAANLLFDLESGDRNSDIAAVLSPDAIFDAVQLSSSLTIHVDAVGYELQPYWPFLTQDNVLEIMEDAKIAIEVALQTFPLHPVSPRNPTASMVLLDTVIRDWRLSSPEDVASSVPDKDKGLYALKIEKDAPSEKVWISIYNKVFDEHGDAVHKSGLHCSIEIRDGIPTLSAGISPDENIIHVVSNTSNQLAVVPESYKQRIEWMPVAFIEPHYFGYCYAVNDHHKLMEARSEIANSAFEQFDFGDRQVIDSSGWDIDDAYWRKTVFFENPAGGDSIKGVFTLTFTDNGTHIIKTSTH